MQTVGELNLNITNLFVILLGAFPYSACILTRIRKVETKAIDTAGVCFDTNGNYILIYNREYLSKLTVPQALALLVHESKHLLYKHLVRFPLPKTNPKLAKRYNLGCDMAINFEVPNLPPGGVYPEAYGLPGGKSADYYIQELEKMEKDAADQNQQNQGSPNSDNKDNDSDDLLDDHSIWDQVLDEDTESFKPLKELGIDSERKNNQTMTQMKEDLVRLQGTIGSKHPIPDYIKTEIELKPPVKKRNWRDSLKREVRNGVDCGETKLTYKRTNRRYNGLDYINPGKKSKKQPKILLVRDTSYSCAVGNIQNLFLNEILCIKALHGGELWVADCDTEIRQYYKVMKKSDFKSFKGKGGTSFVPAFKKALEIKADIIIYFTDLEGEFPTENINRFSKKTIWVTFGNNNLKAPFGETINIE